MGQEILEANNENYQEYVRILGYIVRENFGRTSQRTQQYGQSLFTNDDIQEMRNCSYLQVWKGFFQSFRPTMQGLALNVDVSNCCFTKERPVLDYLSEKLKWGWKGWRNIPPDFSFYDSERDMVLNSVRNLTIFIKHSTSVERRKMKVMGLSEENTENITFNLANTKVMKTMVAYYHETYNYAIRLKKLPCLLIKSKVKQYIPMELCFIQAGEKMPGKLTSLEMEGLVLLTRDKPSNRRLAIEEMMRKQHGPYDPTNLSMTNVYTHAYTLAFNQKMTEVVGRTLKRPSIKCLQDNLIEPLADGTWVWGNNRALEPGYIKYWGLLDFSGGAVNTDECKDFGHSIYTRAKNMGLQLTQDYVLRQLPPETSITAAFTSITSELMAKSQGIRPQLLVVVLENRRSPRYKDIKHYGDTNGFTTQVVTSETVKNGHKNITMTNLLLKVNVKCGGRNFKVLPHPSTFVGNKRCIFFGADVTHPDAGDADSPSLAAVVASNDWPDTGRFLALQSEQGHRVEILQNLQSLAEELMRKWSERNNFTAPDNIIFFRDGVGENQFKQVLREEVDALRKAAHSVFKPKRPKITFAVVQKRHHTRMFLNQRPTAPPPPPQAQQQKQQGQGGRGYNRPPPAGPSTNVPSGVVVDTVITHPREFDFYLYSHGGNLGTSRPSHYHLLWDENNFSIDDFEALTLNLCYGYARCPKAVSMVAPAYYAHLVATRARNLYLAERNMRREQMNRGAAKQPIKLPEIHSDIKAKMYWC
ncbi:unnamed protein product [Sphagnum jensenii]|uniref:Uncharacterized protein n=1 Tax=Sphagnum jensenii TaxID=128206 RepID=A0ABP1AYI2_9BRYO